MILRLHFYSLSLKVATYLLPTLAFILGGWIWLALCLTIHRSSPYSPHDHFGYVLFGTFVWAFYARHYRVTNFDEIFRERTGAKAAGSACIATTFILLATLYFGRNQAFPRGLLVCDIVSLMLLTVVVHAAFRILCRSRAQLAKPVRLLIIGADEFAKSASTRLQRLAFAPCEIGGFVRLPGQEITRANQPIFEMQQLENLNSGHGFDEAVIALHPTGFSQVPQIMVALNHLCLPTSAIVDFGEGVVVRDKLFQLGSMQMMDLMSTPTESLDYVLLKRAFDVGFSSLFLLLASPLLALIAAMIKCTSAGPVFFMQERVGLNGKPFRMYKFRSMRISAKEESDKQWTTEDDPRRTRFGTFLRKTSLDELPQFINVLRGDMSIVGPRPERPHFVHKFLQEVARYNNRHTLKVGITGWAQVNGWRGNTSIEKRVECDLYYLQNWSFAFDLQIIAMTIFSGLMNKNAY